MFIAIVDIMSISFVIVNIWTIYVRQRRLVHLQLQRVCVHQLDLLRGRLVPPLHLLPRALLGLLEANSTYIWYRRNTQT